MVIFRESARSQPLPEFIIQAYLHTSLPLSSDIASLDRIHDLFEIGSQGRFLQQGYELFINDRPEFYGKRPAEIRQILFEEGKLGTEDHPLHFVLLDQYSFTPFDHDGPWEQLAGTAIIVGYFVDEDEVAEGEAIQNPPNGLRAAWKIRCSIEEVSNAIANYDIANVTVLEDLECVGMQYPYDDRFEQTTVSRFDRDFHESMDATVYTDIIALPREYETNMNEDIRQNAGMRPLKKEDGQWHLPEEPVYRLTLEAAREAGLKQRWVCMAWKVDQGTWEKLGQEGMVPEGTMSFQQCFDERDDRWTCNRLQK